MSGVVSLKKMFTIPPISQAKVAVVYPFIGLGTLYQKNDTIMKYRLRVTN